MSDKQDEPRWPCMCCGYRTIPDDSAYAICPICWWEQDTPVPDDEPSYSNAGVTLIDARRNFLLHDVCDPRRADLRAERADPALYRQVVFYRLRPDGSVETYDPETSEPPG